jgi:hypothetical protein
LHLKWINLFAEAQIGGNLDTRGKTSKRNPFPTDRPTSKILCPTLACVTRATAELPSFHGVSQKLLAWPATQVQSGGGIVDTGKPTGSRQSQRQRSQKLTSASGDAVWGAHRPNYIIHGQFGSIFFAPQVPLAPRCTPVVISTKLNSRLSLAPCCAGHSPPSATSKRRPGGPYSR